jgi:hypothetical protein
MLVILNKVRFVITKNLKINASKVAAHADRFAKTLQIRNDCLFPKNKEDLFYQEKRLISVKKYLEKGKIQKRTIFSAGNIIIKKQKYVYDEIFSCALENVHIVAKSNLIYTKDLILHNENHKKRFFISELENSDALLTRKHDNILIQKPLKFESIDEASFACHPLGSNYCHFLLEVLSKVFLYELQNNKNIPIILDQPAIPSISDALEKILSKDRKVIWLQPNECVSVKKLHFISDACYMPWHYKAGAKVITKFHPVVFKKIRDKFLFPKTFRKKSKIFIRRTSKSRSLINENEIFSVLKGKGFFSVEPGFLNFESQLKAFQASSEIVAATGSEIANCIFSRPKTKVFVLWGDHKDLVYNLWQNLLIPMGLKVFNIKGFSFKKNELGYHSHFFVNANAVNNAIKKNKQKN